MRVGDALPLPPDEVRHARVLRLNGGDEIELFDDAGRVAVAFLASAGELVARISAVRAAEVRGAPLTLAVAWPKGKRAALLVEKCVELGADCIIPVRFERSVVTKDEDSDGLARLRRIAMEAAKQCGRNHLPEITVERTLAEVLNEVQGGALVFVLDPHAQKWLPEALVAEDGRIGRVPMLFVVGPEGGFSPAEERSFDSLVRVRVAENVLRVETAAMAACAIARAFLSTSK